MTDTTQQESSSTHSFLLRYIDAYERKAKPWEKKAKKIVSRYTAEKKDGQKRVATYNILWSNIQTLLPALYDRAPTPNIERRFNKNDVLGREASTILERSVTFFIEDDDFSDKIRQAVLDRLLVGRGTVWVRYEATFDKIFNDQAEDSTENETEDYGETESDDAEEADNAQITDDVIEQLNYEDVSYDYVHWKDFGYCSEARTWQENRMVWRRVCMSRSQLVKRFGEEIGNAIPLNSSAEDAEKESDNDRAEIYEIWDKESRKVFWLCRDYPEVLDEREDPLQLKQFFPCPKPLFATLSNDSLIPVPDYEIYFDQARELDVITGRIDLLTQAVRVAGVYDSSAQAVGRLLSEAAENKLIPVDNWAMFGEKGGLKGVVDFMPMDQIIATIEALYNARERVKQEIYEITGMSDIIRGASNPSETATAQQIKGQYASMRLGDMQKDVARFCRDLVRITAEIVSNLFSPETITQISSAQLPSAQEKQMAMMAQQIGQPVPEEIMEKPTIEDVVGLLRDDASRCFRISIETDSTIKVDQEAEKAARTEFLGAVGGCMQQALQVQQPELQPLLLDMMLFGVRGFKAGRELESSFERVKTELEEKAKNPPQPQPDPEQIKAQAEAQKMQNEMQFAQIKAQADEKIKQMEVAIKDKDVAIKDYELQIAKVNASNEINKALIQPVNAGQF